VYRKYLKLLFGTDETPRSNTFLLKHEGVTEAIRRRACVCPKLVESIPTSRIKVEDSTFGVEPKVFLYPSGPSSTRCSRHVENARFGDCPKGGPRIDWSIR